MTIVITKLKNLITCLGALVNFGASKDFWTLFLSGQVFYMEIRKFSLGLVRFKPKIAYSGYLMCFQ